MKFFISTIIAAYAVGVVEGSVRCHQGEFYISRSRRRRAIRSSCRKCAPGYWQNSVDHDNKFCQPCPSGKYTNVFGASGCAGGPACEPGKAGIVGASSENETACKDCVPGRYSSNFGDGPSCLSCPSGLFSSVSNSKVCEGTGPCPAGKYGTMFSTKQGTCIDCPEGKITVKEGLFMCSSCPKGQYQLNKGMSKCIDKEKCGMWKIHQENKYECDYMYNLDLYISLVVLSWISTVLSAIVVWASMGHCISPQMAILVITFSLSVWMSTSHPVNMENGLTDVSFGCLFTYVVFVMFGCINYLLVDIYGDNYFKNICKNNNVNSEKRGDGQTDVQIDVQTDVHSIHPDRAVV